MTTIVELECGCTARTQHTAHLGDNLRCPEHGEVAVREAAYYTNLPRSQKKSLQLVERYESERPRAPVTDITVIDETHVWDEDKFERVSDAVRAGTLPTVHADPFRPARLEQASTIRYLQNQEKRLTATVEATEQILNRMANELAGASGRSPKEIVDRYLKERNLLRREIVGDLRLFAAED